jgi:hypothetical protein
VAFVLKIVAVVAGVALKKIGLKPLLEQVFE